jgi:hypothetical protein
MPPNAGQSLPCPGVPSSPSGGALAGAAQDLAAHHVVGLPRGQRQAGELGVGTGVGARVLWCAAAATMMLGRIHQCQHQPDAGSHGPGPALVGGVAWHRRRLAGVIRAVVAGPLPQAHCQVMTGGSILLGHGVAPGGAWYNNHLKGLVVSVVFFYYLV